jgi:hypothetical protein
MADQTDNLRRDQAKGPAHSKVGNAPDAPQPSEERGERLDTGRTIARGGKAQGDVPGATEKPAP